MEGSGGRDQPVGEHGRRREDTIRLRLVLEADGSLMDEEDGEVDGVRNSEVIDPKGRRSSMTSSHTHTDDARCIASAIVGEGTRMVNMKPEERERSHEGKEEESPRFLPLVTLELPASTDVEKNKYSSSASTENAEDPQLRLWRSPIAPSSTLSPSLDRLLGFYHDRFLYGRRRSGYGEGSVPVYCSRYTKELSMYMHAVLSSSLSSCSSSCSTRLSILTAKGEKQRECLLSSSTNSTDCSFPCSSSSVSSSPCSSLVSPYVPTPLPASLILYSGSGSVQGSSGLLSSSEDSPFVSPDLCGSSSLFSSSCTAYILALRQFRQHSRVTHCSASSSPSQLSPHVLSRLWRNQFAELMNPSPGEEGESRGKGLQMKKNPEEILFSLPTRSWQVEWRRHRYASCTAVRALVECLLGINRSGDDKKEGVEAGEEKTKKKKKVISRERQLAKEQRERLFTVEFLRAAREAEGIISSDDKGQEREGDCVWNTSSLLPVEDGGLDYDWMSCGVPPCLRPSPTSPSPSCCLPSSSFREVFDAHLPYITGPPVSSLQSQSRKMLDFTSPVLRRLPSPRTHSVVSDEMAIAALGLGSPSHTSLGMFESQFGVLHLPSSSSSSSSPWCLLPPAVPFLSLGRKQEVSPGTGWEKPSCRSLVVCDLQIHTPPRASALVCCPACQRGDSQSSQAGCCLLGEGGRMIRGPLSSEETEGNGKTNNDMTKEDSDLFSGSRDTTSVRLLLFLHHPEVASSETGSPTNGAPEFISPNAQAVNGTSRQGEGSTSLRSTEEADENKKHGLGEKETSLTTNIVGGACSQTQLLMWLGKILRQAAWSMRRNERATFFVPLPGLKRPQASNSSHERVDRKTEQDKEDLEHTRGDVEVSSGVSGVGATRFPHSGLLDLLHQIEPPRILPFVFSLHMLDFVSIPSSSPLFSLSSSPVVPVPSLPSSISTTPSTSSLTHSGVSSSSSPSTASSLHIKRAASLLVEACQAQGDLLRVAEDLQNFASIIVELLLHPRYSSFLISLLIHEMDKDDGAGEENPKLTRGNGARDKDESISERSWKAIDQHPHLHHEGNDEELPFPGCESLEEQHLLLSLLQYCDHMPSLSSSSISRPGSKRGHTSASPVEVIGENERQETKSEEGGSNTAAAAANPSSSPSGLVKSSRPIINRGRETMASDDRLSQSHSSTDATTRASGNSSDLGVPSSSSALSSSSSSSSALARHLFLHRSSHSTQPLSSSIGLTTGDDSTAATGRGLSSYSQVPSGNPPIPPTSPKRSRWWSNATRRSSSRSRLLSLLSSGGGGGTGGNEAPPASRSSTLPGNLGTAHSRKQAIKNKKTTKEDAQGLDSSHNGVSGEGTPLGSFESPLRGVPLPFSTSGNGGKSLTLSSSSTTTVPSCQSVAETSETLKGKGSKSGGSRLSKKPAGLSLLSSGGGDALVVDETLIDRGADLNGEHTRPENELDEGEGGEKEDQGKRGKREEKKTTKDDHHSSSRLGGRLSRLRSSALRSPLFRLRPSSVPTTPMVASGGGGEGVVAVDRRPTSRRGKVSKKPCDPHSSDEGHQAHQDDEGDEGLVSPSHHDPAVGKKDRNGSHSISPHRLRRCSFSSLASRKASLENVYRSCVPGTSKKPPHPPHEAHSSGDHHADEIEEHRSKTGERRKDTDEGGGVSGDEEVPCVDPFSIGDKKSSGKITEQSLTCDSKITDTAIPNASVSSEDTRAFFSSQICREDFRPMTPSIGDFAAVEKKLVCRSTLAGWVERRVLSKGRHRGHRSRSSSYCRSEDEVNDSSPCVSDSSSCSREDLQVTEDYQMLLEMFLSGVVIQGIYFQVIASDEVWRQLHAERNAARVALWRDSQFPCPPLFLLLEVASLRLFVAPQQTQEYLPRVLLSGRKPRQQLQQSHERREVSERRLPRLKKKASAPCWGGCGNELDKDEGDESKRTARVGSASSLFGSIEDSQHSHSTPSESQEGVWVDLEPPSRLPSPFSFATLLSAYKQRLSEGAGKGRSLEKEGEVDDEEEGEQDGEKTGGWRERIIGTRFRDQSERRAISKGWERKTVKEISSEKSFRMCFFPPVIDIPFANAQLYTPYVSSCSSSLSLCRSSPVFLQSFLQAFRPALKPTAPLMLPLGEGRSQTEERDNSLSKDERKGEQGKSSTSSQQSSSLQPQVQSDTRLGLIFPFTSFSTTATGDVLSSSSVLNGAVRNEASAALSYRFSSPLSSVSYPYVFKCPSRRMEEHGPGEEEEVLLRRAVASCLDIPDATCLELSRVGSYSGRSTELVNVPPRVSLLCKAVAGLLHPGTAEEPTENRQEQDEENQIARGEREEEDEEGKGEVDNRKGRFIEASDYQCDWWRRRGERHAYHIWLASCDRPLSMSSEREETRGRDHKGNETAIPIERGSCSSSLSLADVSTSRLSLCPLGCQVQDSFLVIVPVGSPPSFSLRMSAFNYEESSWDTVDASSSGGGKASPPSEDSGFPRGESMKATNRSFSSASFYSCPSMSQEAFSSQKPQGDETLPGSSASSSSSAYLSPLNSLEKEIHQVLRILTTEAAGHLGHSQALRSILHARHLPVGLTEWLMLHDLAEELGQDLQFFAPSEGRRRTTLFPSSGSVVEQGHPSWSLGGAMRNGLVPCGEAGEGKRISTLGQGERRPRNTERTKEVFALLCVDTVASAVKRFTRSRAREALGFRWPSVSPDCKGSKNLHPISSSCSLSCDSLKGPSSSPFDSFSDSIAAISSWLLSPKPPSGQEAGQGRCGWSEGGYPSAGRPVRKSSSSSSPSTTTSSSSRSFQQTSGEEEIRSVTSSVVVCISLAGLRACTVFPRIGENFPQLLHTIMAVATAASSRSLLQRALGHHLGLSIPSAPSASSSSARSSVRGPWRKGGGEEGAFIESRERSTGDQGFMWECVSLSSALYTSSTSKSMRYGGEREQERQEPREKKEREEEKSQTDGRRKDNCPSRVTVSRGKGVRVWIRPRLKTIIDAEDVACVGLSTAQLAIDSILGNLSRAVPAPGVSAEHVTALRSSPDCSDASSTTSSFSSLPPSDPTTTDDEKTFPWPTRRSKSSSRVTPSAGAVDGRHHRYTPGTLKEETQEASSPDLFRWIKKNSSLASTGAEMLLPSVMTLVEHTQRYGARGEGENLNLSRLASSALQPSTSGGGHKESRLQGGKQPSSESEENKLVCMKGEQGVHQGGGPAEGSVLRLPILQATFLSNIHRSFRGLAIAQAVLRCLGSTARHKGEPGCSPYGERKGWKNKRLAEDDKKVESEVEQRTEFLTRLGTSVGTLHGLADRHLLHLLFQLVLSFDPWKGISTSTCVSERTEEERTPSKISRLAQQTERRRRGDGEEENGDAVEEETVHRQQDNEHLFVGIVTSVESILVSVHCSLELQIAFLLLQGLNRLQRGFLSSARMRLMKAIDLLEDLWGPLFRTRCVVPANTKRMREEGRAENKGDNVAGHHLLDDQRRSFLRNLSDEEALRCETNSGVHPLLLFPAWLLLNLAYCGAVTPSSLESLPDTTTLSTKPSTTSRSPSETPHEGKHGGSAAAGGQHLLFSHHYAMSTSAPWSGSSFELSTACIPVYLEFIRLLRLKFPSFPLPVGPPHLVPRDLEFSPQITIDRRCKPRASSCVRLQDGDRTTSLRGRPEEEHTEEMSSGGNRSFDMKNPSKSGDNGKNALFAGSPSGSSGLRVPGQRGGDLQEMRNSEALRLFGCTYSPKYPQGEHCHLPEVSVLPPNRAAAIVLFNLCRVLPEVQQWVSSFDIFSVRGDHASSVAQACAGYTTARLLSLPSRDSSRFLSSFRKDSSFFSYWGSGQTGESEAPVRGSAPMECVYTEETRTGSLGLVSQPVSCSPPSLPLSSVTLLPSVYIHSTAQQRGGTSDYSPLGRPSNSLVCGGSSPSSLVKGGECSKSMRLREELVSFKREMHVFLSENESHLRRWYESQRHSTSLAYACGSNGSGALGLGRPSFFPFDPVLGEEENAIELNKGIDLW